MLPDVTDEVWLVDEVGKGVWVREEAPHLFTVKMRNRFSLKAITKEVEDYFYPTGIKAIILDLAFDIIEGGPYDGQMGVLVEVKTVPIAGS